MIWGDNWAENLQKNNGDDDVASQDSTSPDQLASISHTKWLSRIEAQLSLIS